MQARVRSILGTCIAQLEDQLERQTNELKQQRAITRSLDAQLDCKQQEIQWLRDRVCQLQHSQTDFCCQNSYMLITHCTLQR